ncbi:hypothetical protein FORC36_2517 [Vibrio vulnificus]|uniref:Uncharacterized protein n=1 Tax=Vibrio vulnificus TaxID=672 RepID=A0AAN1PLA6_VIBVL|nr:hypothetical protein VVMO6_00396 [Vibrio vulnificus MO6-24/O]ALM69818.1 hypothetical protein FORC9_0301 [Vibrio vulnificus]ANH64379.1 hypothetical protein FORC16_2496 [Vibrio vulnificus]ANN25422.1 hypothetical protein FORC17_0359 [Vibrio vulnificus]ARN67034.1 hypothetical protein FORC36_2517 [Vibrio vulnificus]
MDQFVAVKYGMDRLEKPPTKRHTTYLLLLNLKMGRHHNAKQHIFNNSANLLIFRTS